MQPELDALRTRLAELTDLRSASAVLTWDQANYMPAMGAGGRGRQLATLARVHHEHLIDPELGRLLERLANADLAPLDAAQVRVTARDAEFARRVPADLIAKVRGHCAETRQAWNAAKEADDPRLVLDHLRTTVELSRAYSACFDDAVHPADPHIQAEDHGATAASVGRLMKDLRAVLVPLVADIAAAEPIDDSMLHQLYPVDEQQALAARIAASFGYDYRRGRQDLTAHPFMISFGHDDVRINTRFEPDDLARGLFSTMHEAGHGIYEQGLDPALAGTPLGSGTSAGVHESQSRLWENLVGRSYGLWSQWFPALAAQFPKQLRGVDVPTFFRAVNNVRPKPIRRGSDEVTYNLHIAIRVDLEAQLLSGELDVADLPDAWNARYESDLGVTPPSHTEGFLQDVHWYAFLIGGRFGSYAIGNILAGQLYAAACADHPEIPDAITAGDTSVLLGWLRDRVHRHGRILDPDDLVQEATGKPLAVADYGTYLRDKYTALYDLA